MDDEERINNGEDPHEIQKENSIFPPGFFENGTFNNFGKSVSS